MMAGESANSDAPSAAVDVCPNRFRWAKRIVAAYLLLAVALLVTRWVWGHLADRRVAAELAAIAARGETVDWLALEPAPIPDAENAAVFYQRACMAVSMSDDQHRKLYPMLGSPSFRTKHRTDADAILLANAAVFAECRNARAAPSLNWGVKHISPAHRTRLPSIGDSKALARLLCLKSLRQTECGDSAGAIETLRDVEALGRAMSRQLDFIGHGLSTTIHSFGVTAIEEISPQLEVASKGGATAPGAGPAAPQAVRRLIDDLLDEHLLASSQEAMVFERAFINDVAETALNTPGGVAEMGDMGSGSGRASWRDVLTQWVLLPMFRCDQVRLLRHAGQRVEAAGQTSLPSARTLRNDTESGVDTESRLFLFTRAMSDGLEGSFCDFVPVFQTYSLVAERRLAATTLALRLYEIEHGGAARSLAELVPEYLRAVPTDPTDPAGKPIRALLTAPKPRLYSLGDNMADDWGTLPDTFWPGDIVFFLRKGDRPEPSDE